MGNNTYLDMVGIGAYRLDLDNSAMVPKNMIFVPGLMHNLIYVSAQLKMRFYNNRILIGKDKKKPEYLPKQKGKTKI